MKKKYVKPSIYMEDFTLSQSVAAGGCGVPKEGNLFGKPGYASKDECAWDMGNVSVWNTTIENSPCTFDGGDEFEGYCYNNPEGGITIFSHS